MNTAPNLVVYVDGIGVIGPGFTGWQACSEKLGAAEPLSLVPLNIPVADCLPAAERRRVGLQIKMALSAGQQAVSHAGQNAAQLPNVFSASHGEGENCHGICEALASSERQISPTRFHNSVHNAAAGYWGIAMQCMAASTSLCAFDGSFAAGLLEAAAQALETQNAVLLVTSDTPYPEPLNGARPMQIGFAASMVLSPTQSSKSLAKLSLHISSAAPSHLARADLEQIRLCAPAARSLPLLLALANPTSTVTSIQLDYLAGCSLGVQLENLAI